MANAQAIFHSPNSFIAGNPDGDVSVVAFFDHNCPDCRADVPALTKLNRGEWFDTWLGGGPKKDDDFLLSMKI